MKNVWVKKKPFNINFSNDIFFLQFVAFCLFKIFNNIFATSTVIKTRNLKNNTLYTFIYNKKKAKDKNLAAQLFSSNEKTKIEQIVL